MRIMVFDVPAESGGALTILNQYYNKAINDTGNDWIFVISTPELKETGNVKIINYPWIKKSWFHRLFFDRFIAPKLVKKHEADEVLSLQNVLVPKVKVKQTLYLHQPLPFVEKSYGITENLTFWIYQNIISKLIFKSLVKADCIIVQTKWMMKACMEKVNINSNKFILMQPKLNINVKKFYEQEKEEFITFFYPSSGLEYKNHKVVVEAVNKLDPQHYSRFRIVFTLKGNENKHINELYAMVTEKSLPIEFIGQISIDEVYDYYTKSVLIFPSYIETFGLPMLEAKLHRSPVIASDCAFSREILDGYEKAEFFNPFDFDNLQNILLRYIKG